jgi:hypothetical protein
MSQKSRLHTVSLIAALAAFAITAGNTFAQPTPGYNNRIPSKIMTPDTVETRIGTLEFFDGFPTNGTTEKVFDNLDFMRGVEVFLNGVPATSLEGLRLGNAELGATNSNQVVIMDELLDSNPLFLTGNTDTVYASAFLDLKRDGPTVVEIPAGCGPGTVNDAWFRFVTDMGIPGPDKGEGGRYLILPPNHKGDAPDGYFVSKSRTFVNWLILRGFLVDGKPDASATMFKTGLKIYPLKSAKNPSEMQFISGSRKAFNTIHANNYEFYEELNEVIQKEPVRCIEPQLRGLISSIGIQKGKPFKPDARMKKILTEAVAVGNATARAIAFQTRDPDGYYYQNSYWKTAFVGGDYQWLIDGGKGGRNLDARAQFFYIATVNTPAMAAKMVGKGSQYAYCEKDKHGEFLDGGKTYKLTIPPNVPAKDFWSVVIYDPQTRSELQTGQPFPSKNNERDELDVNSDGSVELFFGPSAPKGKDKNWIQTVPDKGWFAILRLYGPLEPWFEKTWKPGEFELVR